MSAPSLVCKAISNGHTSAAGIEEYLKSGEENPRVDIKKTIGNVVKYLNEDGRSLRTIVSPGLSENNWGWQMSYMNMDDSPSSIQWKHYVLSVGETQETTLDTLAKVATEWCEKNFGNNPAKGEFPYAIEFHRDNTNAILHAHCVICSTNQEVYRPRGHYKKLHISNADAIQISNSAQEIAAKYGLAQLFTPHDGYQKFKTDKDVYLNQKERMLLKNGKLSIKMIARRILSEAILKAESEEEFFSLLEEKQYQITLDKDKQDYLFSYKDNNPSSGMNYGKLFTREAILKQIEANRIGKDTESVSKYKFIAQCAKSSSLHKYCQAAIDTALRYSLDVDELIERLQENYGIKVKINANGETVFTTPVGFEMKSIFVGEDYDIKSLEKALSHNSKAKHDNIVDEAEDVIEEAEKKFKKENQYYVSWHDDLRSILDEVLIESQTKDEFRDTLQYKYGITLPRDTEKTISYLMPGRDKQVRGHRLGYKYTAENIDKYFKQKAFVSGAIVEASVYSWSADSFKDYLKDKYDISIYIDENNELTFVLPYTVKTKDGQFKEYKSYIPEKAISLNGQIADAYMVKRSYTITAIALPNYRQAKYLHYIQHRFDQYSALSELETKYKFKDASGLMPTYKMLDKQLSHDRAVLITLEEMTNKNIAKGPDGEELVKSIAELKNKIKEAETEQANIRNIAKEFELENVQEEIKKYEYEKENNISDESSENGQSKGAR